MHQILANQQRLTLQPGQKNMEVQFSEKLVQAHRIPFHAVDQYLYRWEYLLVLKQPLCSSFFKKKLKKEAFQTVKIS